MSGRPVAFDAQRETEQVLSGDVGWTDDRQVVLTAKTESGERSFVYDPALADVVATQIHGVARLLKAGASLEDMQRWARARAKGGPS